MEPSRFELVRERGFFSKTEERVGAMARLGEAGARSAFVDPGAWSIEVEADGYLTQSIPVQLVASGVCDRTVRLQPDDSPK